jgi:hypothetical protein
LSPKPYTKEDERGLSFGAMGILKSLKCECLPYVLKEPKNHHSSDLFRSMAGNWLPVMDL